MRVNLETKCENYTIKVGDVIKVRENEEIVNYLICEDDARLFLVDLVDFSILGIYEESTIEIFLENYEIELLEVIPSEQLEIRRICNNEKVDSIRKTSSDNTTILNIISAYEDLTNIEDVNNSHWRGNNNITDLNVVYSDDGENHCALDVQWDYDDENSNSSKLVIRLYAFNRADIVGVRDLSLKEVSLFTDETLDKVMNNFLIESLNQR